MNPILLSLVPAGDMVYDSTTGIVWYEVDMPSGAYRVGDVIDPDAYVLSQRNEE